MLTGRFEPVRIRGGTKYGSKGLCDEKMFGDVDIPQSVKQSLARIGNFGLAKSTWSSYKTGERMLMKCKKECEGNFELPLGKGALLIFINWLITSRGLKAATINCYLASIRQMHLVRGLEPPALRSSQVQLILKGQQNIDNEKRREGESRGRLPMTISLMKLLKEKIRRWGRDDETKLLVWAVATMAFHGAFRIHELLCKNEASFDPAYELLGEDIVTTAVKEGDLVTTMITVKLKCPKEQRDGKAVLVDIFESGGPICPVRAFQKWKLLAKCENGKPAFRGPCGTPLTGRKLNSYVKDLLKDSINYREGQLTTHSFRSGIASLLGSKGFSDEEIKQAGRWSSNAFQVYMKLPRTKRAAIARRIGQL
jgi:hypothetical protein